MPEDKNISNPTASSNPIDQPRVDMTALDEQSRQYDSPTVDLARPNAPMPTKQKLPSKPANDATTPPPELSPEPQPAEHNKGMLAYVLVGLLLLALIGGTLWWFMGRSDEAETPIAEGPVLQPMSPALSVMVDTLETEETKPQLSGSVSDPTAEVLVDIDGTEYVAEVDEEGNWQAVVDQTLEPGPYDVTVRVRTEDGREAEDSSTNELTILAAEPEPEPAPELEPEPTPAPAPQPRPQPEPEQVPDTGPGDSLPNTGPGDSRRPH